VDSPRIAGRIVYKRTQGYLGKSFAEVRKGLTGRHRIILGQDNARRHPSTVRNTFEKRETAIGGKEGNRHPTTGHVPYKNTGDAEQLSNGYGKQPGGGGGVCLGGGGGGVCVVGGGGVVGGVF